MTMTTTTVYRARRILTMNPARPFATHVAVRDGRILGAGSLEELAGWGACRLDDAVRRQVPAAGLRRGPQPLDGGRVVALRLRRLSRPDGSRRSNLDRRPLDRRGHRTTGGAGRQARRSPAARWSAGVSIRSISASGRCDRHALDRISTTRPVAIVHASLHIMNANTPALAAAGYLREGLVHPGLPLAADGLPTGECKGPDAMAPVAAEVGMDRGLLAADTAAVRAFSRLCVRKGVTTATDLAAPLTPESVAGMLQVTGEPALSDPHRRAAAPARADAAAVDRPRAGVARPGQRAPATGHGQGGRRRLDPGLLRAPALAGLLQRAAQRPLVHGARAGARDPRAGARARRAGAHAYQRRRGHRHGARCDAGRAGRQSASRTIASPCSTASSPTPPSSAASARSACA